MKIEKHENCKSCELFQTCNSPWMESSGAEDPLVLVIGEAPGATEDEKGIPFVGQSGQLLRETLDATGFSDDELRFTNVVRCRPPDNKISKKAVNACRHYVLDEIEHYDPEVVLLLGNTPLNAILGESGITTWNGVIVERDYRIYIPLFHPAYILRNKAAMDDWLMGFIQAEELLNGDDELESNEPEYIFPKTVQEVEEMRDFLSKHEWISFDVETTSLDPWYKHVDEDYYQDATIIAIGFAAGNRAYGLLLDHKEQLWEPKDLKLVYSCVQGILQEHTGSLVGHNTKFDQLWVKKVLDCEVEAGGDSMLVSHLIDSRKGIHSLKRLAGVHIGMYDYDGELQQYIRQHPECNPGRTMSNDEPGHYGNIPSKLLLPYVAMDAWATLELHDTLFQELTEQQQILYEQMIIPVSNSLMRMEFNGNALDDFIVRRYHMIYNLLQEELYEELLEHPAISKLLKSMQEKYDKRIMRQMYADANPETPDIEESLFFDSQYFKFTEDRAMYEDGNKSYNRQRQIAEFNPNSHLQISELYYEILGMPVLEETDAGNPTVKESVTKVLEEDYPIVGRVNQYRALTKAIGTYLDPAINGEWSSGDGKVRSNYNLHGTKTGRLSSSNPNMQNIPTPESRPGTILETLPIKNIFTHSWGYNGSWRNPKGVLIATDYSGMELRVFASLAKCEPMLEIHRSGRDFHKMVAAMISGIPYDDIDKPTRYIYKWTNWTLLYGGTEFTLHSLYDIPIDEARNAVDRYYRRFPEVLEFREWTQQFAETYGFIESPYGRREHLPYINDQSERNVGKRNQNRRAAVNMPVQSAASDTLNFAVVLIDKAIREAGMKARMVNIVHDEVVADVPIEEVDEYVEIAEDRMENIVEYGKEEFPGVDFSWLMCPLEADAEIGTHHGVKIPYSEYISNGRQLP